MKRKIFFWILFVLITVGAGVSSAQETPLTDIEDLLIPEELLPASWSTVATQASAEEGNIKLFQYLSTPQSPVEISFIVDVDPESAIFDGLNSDTSFDFETKDLEVPLESGTVVIAKVQKIKKEDPKVQFDVARLIRMFAHYEGFTFTVTTDSWVLLESAGDPEKIIEETFIAALGQASKFDLKGADIEPTTTTIPDKVLESPTPPPTSTTQTTQLPIESPSPTPPLVTKQPSSTTSTSITEPPTSNPVSSPSIEPETTKSQEYNFILIVIVVLLLAILVIWFVLKKKG
jgi:hypothetical protein